MSVPIDVTPYSRLDPNLILSAIESAGYVCSGSLTALNSYKNRVYQVGLENEAVPIIVKFYRPARWSFDAIREEHQFSLELLDLEIPVVAPLIATNGETLHEYEGYLFAAFPRKGGHALELDNMEQLEWMGRIIGRMHAVGECKDFTYRATLDVASAEVAFRYLIEHDFVTPQYKDKYKEVVTQLLEKIQQRFSDVGKVKKIRLHGDCHAGNILWNVNGPQIVDLDDCMMGPAMQDLWMMLSGNREQTEIQLNTILDGYCEFYDYNPREIHLIEALRSLRMINYSAWLAKRWEDPAFPLSFPWFKTENYWADQIINLSEQILLLTDRIERGYGP